MRGLLIAALIALTVTGCVTTTDDPQPSAAVSTATSSTPAPPTAPSSAPPATRTTTTTRVPTASAPRTTTTSVTAPETAKGCTGTDPKDGRAIRYELTGYTCEQAKADWKTYLNWSGPVEGSGGFADIRSDTQCWSNNLEPWGGCEISDGPTFEVYSR